MPLDAELPIMVCNAPASKSEEQMVSSSKKQEARITESKQPREVTVFALAELHAKIIWLRNEGLQTLTLTPCAEGPAASGNPERNNPIQQLSFSLLPVRSNINFDLNALDWSLPLLIQTDFPRPALG